MLKGITTFSTKMSNLHHTLLYLKKIFVITIFFIVQSCSTVESTWDTVADSVSDAGDYFYDSIIFWDEDEPVESEVMLIEEVAEVPEFEQIDENQFIQRDFNQTQPTENFLGNPVYKSARQYYYVSPNGSPMPAPPPPPFPQYSIGNQPGFYSNETPREYGYENFNTIPEINNQNFDNFETYENQITVNPVENTNVLSYEEEMELYGIENSCVRVVEDYMNGGFKCDDFD